MGSRWMLEMLRCDDTSRTLGLFLAAYGIVQLRHLNVKNGEFIGFSTLGDPPATWLNRSMVFEMGTMPLPDEPEQLLELVKEPWPHIPVEIGLQASDLSKRAKMRIASTYQARMPISKIARELGVSHAHLTRQFRRDFEFTPLEYRHRLQVNEAVQRLRHGDKILDAAYNAGFNDASRFYEDFRKVTATSPGKCLDLIKKRKL